MDEPRVQTRKEHLDLTLSNEEPQKGFKLGSEQIKMYSRKIHLQKLQVFMTRAHHGGWAGLESECGPGWNKLRGQEGRRWRQSFGQCNQWMLDTLH